MSRAKNSTILVGVSRSEMRVVQNPENLNAPRLQKRLMDHIARFGKERVVNEIRSSNWEEIYDKAIKVEDIGRKGRSTAPMIDLRNYSGPATRAILIEGNSTVVLNRWKDYWGVANRTRRLFAPEVRTEEEEETIVAESVAEVEPVEEKVVPVESVAEVVEPETLSLPAPTISLDNPDLETAAILTVLNLSLFPVIFDRDEQGNLTVETECGRMTVALAA